MDGEKEYKRMITKIKEIACEFTDDVEKARVPTVLMSIAKRTSQHLKQSISVRHHMQTRYDLYLQVDKGWDELVNSIPLPNTDLTIIQRSEPEVGLNVDEERIRDHMPRPVKLDGMDENTKLLGALVHWVMRNNLLTIINKFPAKQASRDFNVSYGKLRRVITGVKQHGGLYY